MIKAWLINGEHTNGDYVVIAYTYKDENEIVKYDSLTDAYKLIDYAMGGRGSGVSSARLITIQPPEDGCAIEWLMKKDWKD